MADLTCRECKPADALIDGRKHRVVALCPTHATAEQERDELRKQLEEARQEVELLKTQLAGSLMVQRTRRAEVERLREALYKLGLHHVQ